MAHSRKSHGFLFRLMQVLVALLLLVGAGYGALCLYGRDAVWEQIAGPADDGPYDFDAPKRTGWKNDWLICPAGECAGGRPDEISAPFPVSADRLFATVLQDLKEDPHVTITAVDETTHRLRAIARTELMHFPDRIHIRVDASGESTSLLDAYSASQLGRGDFGVNRSRLERLLAELRAQLS
ncbi:hypothetical protein HDIA_3467 [Hartmannibacter diazotrophicus]|uniref:DUF1499 domain-containing protein n=1 Tax=Hartmannibacter diazotrophicus TaxID=1482074 RepID=A0A2C9DA46_9HYPH|nr:DUF1499 domain-containing protein [Hartmannibacter diazotrophicus]SON57008.1 hypothetical protein HDIA_3467 [Hartmannibacter diazotrophicus]